MTQEKRKARRQTLRHPAWLAFGPSELHGCKLSDVSASGARIDVEENVTLPDHFMLFLTNNGAARRACRGVWRNEQQIGVRVEPRRRPRPSRNRLRLARALFPATSHENVTAYLEPNRDVID